MKNPRVKAVSMSKILLTIMTICRFIFEFTTSKVDEKVKWTDIIAEVEKKYGIKVVYCRLNQTDGHFAVNSSDLTDKIKHDVFQVDNSKSK
jgi:hypothetical protein